MTDAILSCHGDFLVADIDLACPPSALGDMVVSVSMSDLADDVVIRVRNIAQCPALILRRREIPVAIGRVTRWSADGKKLKITVSELGWLRD